MSLIFTCQASDLSKFKLVKALIIPATFLKALLNRSESHPTLLTLKYESNFKSPLLKSTTPELFSLKIIYSLNYK